MTTPNPTWLNDLEDVKNRLAEVEAWIAKFKNSKLGQELLTIAEEHKSLFDRLKDAAKDLFEGHSPAVPSSPEAPADPTVPQPTTPAATPPPVVPQQPTAQ